MTEGAGGRRVSEMIRTIFNAPGLDAAAREMATERLSGHLLKCARDVLGARRNLLVQLDLETGRTRVIQRMRLADAVRDPDVEIAIDEARRRGIDGAPGQVFEFELHQDPTEEVAARRFDARYGDILRLTAVEGSVDATRKALDRKLNVKLALELAPTMGFVRAALKNAEGAPAPPRPEVAPAATAAPMPRPSPDARVAALTEAVRDLLAVVVDQQRRLDAIATSKPPEIDVEAALRRVAAALDTEKS